MSGEMNKNGRSAGGANSQVVRRSEGLGIAGGGSLWDSAPGAHRSGQPFATDGLHNSPWNPRGSKRNSAPEGHWRKWRIYTFSFSLALTAIGIGATLTEVLGK